MKKLLLRCQKSIATIWRQVFLTLCLISVYQVTFADTIIPTSTTDQTTGDSDVSKTFMNVLQKEIIPLIEIVLALFVLVWAILGLKKGYEKYHDSNDFDHMKKAIISSVLLIVFAGVIIYLLDHLRTFKFT